MGKSIEAFQILGDDEATAYLAQSLPKGKLWADRFDADSDFYKLLTCLSQFIKVNSEQLNNLVKNIDIQQAEELLQEWGKSVFIPASYMRLSTDTARRNAIQRLISKVPVFNFQGYRSVDNYTTFEELILLLTGLTVTITRGDLISGNVMLFGVWLTGTYIEQWIIDQINLSLDNTVSSNMQWNILVQSAIPLVDNAFQPLGYDFELTNGNLLQLTNGNTLALTFKSASSDPYLFIDNSEGLGLNGFTNVYPTLELKDGTDLKLTDGNLLALTFFSAAPDNYTQITDLELTNGTNLQLTTSNILNLYSATNIEYFDISVNYGGRISGLLN
jgi:hypothetical protein